MTLDRPWEGPLDHPGITLDPDLKKVPNINKNTILSDLILDTFFIKFSVCFLAFVNYVLGNPPNHFLKDLEVMLSQFLE